MVCSTNITAWQCKIHLFGLSFDNEVNESMWEGTADFVIIGLVDDKRHISTCKLVMMYMKVVLI